MMNKIRGGIAVLALFASATTLAADCGSALATTTSRMSVVAPEMQPVMELDPACISAAAALAALRVQSAPAIAQGAGAYVPLTKDDNSPWRFDMSQNGKQMTSVEFDAWMKAKGIRVATGKPSTTSAPAAPTASSPSQ